MCQLLNFRYIASNRQNSNLCLVSVFSSIAHLIRKEKVLRGHFKGPKEVLGSIEVPDSLLAVVQILHHLADHSVRIRRSEIAL